MILPPTTNILLAFALVPALHRHLVAATNLNVCKNEILNHWNALNQSNGLNSTSSSNSTSDSWALCSLSSTSVVNGSVSISYKECVCQCGGGPGAFSWILFSQNFSTWLLPWIALIFQLPFGSENKFDNLMSVLLAMGSPALAGYSLAITRLNNRWMSKRFAKFVKYPNGDRVPIVLSSLQHIPIKLGESPILLPSLITLPHNDWWWSHMTKMSHKTRQWNIPAAMNICWVTIAVIFTVVDSFADFGSFLTLPGDTGYAVSAVWSYLLPLVVGWMQVGSQPDANHLRDALNEANSDFWVATSSAPVVHSTNSDIDYAIDYAKHDVQRVQNDEKRSAPIFNYARVFKWSQQAEIILRLYANASKKAGAKTPVGGDEWIPSTQGVNQQNRTGTVTQVVRYCMGDALPPSEPSTSRNADFDSILLPLYSMTREPLWAHHVLRRVFFAALLGLALQFGTTGAAIMIHFETPPRGIGCRSLTFLLYGVFGIVVFLLMLTSSILAHRARTTSGEDSVQGFLAVLFRTIGKGLGVLNGLGLIAGCLMQFAGVYDNCFCSSTIFGGSHNGVVSFLEPGSVKKSTVFMFWIGGTVLALGSSALYSLSIYIASLI